MLKNSVGEKISSITAWKKFLDYRMELNEMEPLRPGVLDYLRAAKSLSLKVGLASSSPISWVGFHLDRLGIRNFFDCIRTFEDVHQTKPDPQLFLLTLNCLRLAPSETVALEDSKNGVMAAKSAGLITVAVPNPVTSRFAFENADLTLSSLEEMALDELIAYFEEKS
jgi:HAD superfamily hydrolase (TIGR01509 family)